MTEARPAAQRRLSLMLWVSLIAVAATLQACAPEQAVRRSKNRIFAADLAGGAKVCQVPKVTPTDGQATEVPMGLGNDGGWCGLPVQRGDAPFSAGLLTSRPTHGSVLIHQVGDFTRIDYRPDRGFTGADNFTVKLVPGGAILRINVTVTGTAKT